MKLFLLISLLITSLQAETLSVQEIVKKSDEIRNPSGSFYQRALITQYKNAKPVDSMLLDIYSKKIKQKYRTIVKMLKPKKDRDKLIFSSGNSMWLYDPNSKAISQISPQQRLMGESSSADVVSADFAHDYTLKLQGIEKIKDGKRKLKKCYEIFMHAKNNDVSYAYVEYWVGVDDLAPVKANFYSLNKDLLKISYYRNFKNVLGVQRPTQILILDSVNPRKATKLEFSDIKEKEFPDYWFNKEYLFEFHE